MGYHESTWTAADTVPRRLHCWEPVVPPKAVLLALHGMGGNGTDFRPIGEFLAARECAVWAPNLRSNGLDPVVHNRGHFLDRSVFHQDMVQLGRDLTAAYPGVPWFLAGESMGAMLAITGSLEAEFQPPPTGLVLLSPVVELANPVSPLFKKILELLGWVCPRLPFSPSKIIHGRREMPRLSRDPDRMAFLKHDPDRVSDYTVGFLWNMGLLMEAARSSAAQVNRPVLVIYAGDDVFIRSDQTEAWLREIPGEWRTACFLPEACHQIFHDWDRDQALAALGEWLDRQIPGLVKAAGPD